MKAFFRLALYAIILAGFGCEEQNNLINYQSDEFNTLKIDSNYQSASTEAAQPRNVLLEDFTAVKCVNCPRAQKEAKTIQELHPGRVVVNSVHVSSLGIPYEESKDDYRTTEGENLLAYMGGASGLPIGSVDRKLFDGNKKPFIYDIQWRALVDQQLAVSTPVNISFTQKVYNEADRTLKLQIKVTYTEAVNVPQYLSVFVNESNITDLQLTPNGIDSHYVHNHALRAFMLPHSGLKLADNFQKGQTFVVSLTAKFPEKWIAENCHFAAFVHQRDNNFEVIHVQETDVK